MTDDITLVIPILPGKAEAWRRSLQELEGSRHDEFTAWSQMVGIHLTSLFLRCAPGGDVVVMNLDIVDSANVTSYLADDRYPFSRWLCDRAMALYGVDLRRMTGQRNELADRLRKSASEHNVGTL